MSGVRVVDAVRRGGYALPLKTGGESWEAEGAEGLAGALCAKGRARQTLIILKEVIDLAKGTCFLNSNWVDRTVEAVLHKGAARKALP